MNARVLRQMPLGVTFEAWINAGVKND